MILVLLILLPLLGGIASLVLKGKNSWYIGIIVSIAVILLSLLGYQEISGEGSNGFFDFQQQWIPEIGAQFSLSMNNIGFLMCVMTGIVFLLNFLALENKIPERASRFFGLSLLAMSGLLGVFLAKDALLFYIFWELALIPVYFLCSMYGGENRVKASFKFFIYTFIGSLLMLVAILYIHQASNVHSFAWADFVEAGSMLPQSTQCWLFAGFFIAFAIKMPIFPFHTWQPDTYEQSATPVTVILSAVMVKMGLFAVLVWLLPVLDAGAICWSNWVLLLCVISIIYASLMALVQTNIKRLAAYSSVAHIGLMCAAIFSYTTIGREGAMLQMFNHGINILGMWLLVHIIEHRLGTQDMRKMGGLAKTAPVFAIALVLISLANIALPLTNSFAPEFMMLNGLFNSESQFAIYFAIFAGLAVILGAIYTLNMIQRVALGPESEASAQFADLSWNERIALFAIMAIILVLGFCPGLLINLLKLGA